MNRQFHIYSHHANQVQLNIQENNEMAEVEF